MESLRILESPDKGSDGSHCLGKSSFNTMNHELQKLGVSLSEVMFSFKSRRGKPFAVTCSGRTSLARAWSIPAG